MLDLSRRGRDVKAFVASLEGWLISTLARLGVEGARLDGQIGVFVHGAKIASIGVRGSRGIPSPVANPQNILVAVLSTAWTSSPRWRRNAKYSSEAAKARSSRRRSLDPPGVAGGSVGAAPAILVGTINRAQVGAVRQPLFTG